LASTGEKQQPAFGGQEQYSVSRGSQSGGVIQAINRNGQNGHRGTEDGMGNRTPFVV